MPVWPWSFPSHQSKCESVFEITVILSPAWKLKSPGCCPSKEYSAVTSTGWLGPSTTRKRIQVIHAFQGTTRSTFRWDKNWSPMVQHWLPQGWQNAQHTLCNVHCVIKLVVFSFEKSKCLPITFPKPTWVELHITMYLQISVVITEFWIISKMILHFPPFSWKSHCYGPNPRLPPSSSILKSQPPRWQSWMRLMSS